MSLRDILCDSGPLAKAIPHYTFRPQQLAFAEQVATALEERAELLVEAGTGTGKTLAYLLPCFLSGKKCLISTGTKNLQDQLFHKDIPALKNALGDGTVVALLKGRSNYLCPYRLQRNSVSGRFISREQALDFQRIEDWARHTQSGDIAEMSSLSEDSPVWALATSTADSCLGSDCEFIDRCPVNTARAKAQKADIVVINHHLFFADLALRSEGVGELLPGCDAIIFDEAHQLPETGIQFFGTILSARQITELLNDGSAEAETSAPENKAAIEKHNKRVLDTLHALLARLGNTHRAAWQTLAHDDALQNQIQRLREQLHDTYQLFETLAERSKGLQNIRERALALHERLSEFLRAEENTLQWFESRKTNFVLHKTPLEIAKPFQDTTARFKQAKIFTSATLSTGARFDYFKTRLGLGEIKTAQWPSPFDYEHRCLLYLPPDMPAPNDANFNSTVLDRAIPVIKACGGRTFFLFTSHHALNEAAQRLKTEIEFPLLVQGDGSKRKLLERFRELGNAVLLGAASFWEGVDVKGEALSCVIIDRLPFASPGDPITAARIDEMKRRGEDPFMTYQLPHALIALRQGVGRLIRDETDRGVLMLCDPRVLSKHYGKAFLRALPRMPITQHLYDVKNFMQREVAI